MLRKETGLLLYFKYKTMKYKVSEQKTPRFFPLMSKLCQVILFSIYSSRNLFNSSQRTNKKTTYTKVLQKMHGIMELKVKFIPVQKVLKSMYRSLQTIHGKYVLWRNYTLVSRFFGTKINLLITFSMYFLKYGHILLCMSTNCNVFYVISKFCLFRQNEYTILT